MAGITDCGYMGKVLRTNLTTGLMTEDVLEEATVKKYIGGTGLGMMYLYKEVPSGVKWSDPENRFILMSGPLSGTVGGAGGYSVVTKGPMTNGPASTQANGFWGAFIKSSGFDGVIVEGASKDWVYLYIHDGTVEVRDARHLSGKNTWETSEAIEKQLGKNSKQLSTVSIGPAGENLVRFACMVSDRGHVASHNGVGAVMGSKKLKAIAVARGKSKVTVKDRELLNKLHKEIQAKVKKHPWNIWQGTTSAFIPFGNVGILPVKNYTVCDWSGYEKFDGSNYRKSLNMERTTCWGCPLNHLHIVRITKGPYKGFVGEEAENEAMIAWGPLTGNKDVEAAIVLSNEVDWLGLDTNESGWMIAWLMECFEEGILSKKDMDGLEMTWGNVGSTRKMLKKIAYREGVGDLLAEGVMRVANKLGGEAAERAIFTKRGNTPRDHDHRTIWNLMFDTTVSNTGSDEVAVFFTPPEDLGLPEETDRCTPEGAALVTAAAAKIGARHLLDSLVICLLSTYGSSKKEILSLLNAATGWTENEVDQFGFRIYNLLRAFAMRHGHTADLDEPSLRYASEALAGGGKGKSILPNWKEARETYYEAVGWDRRTGKPLPETLKSLGLEFVIQDLWP